STTATANISQKAHAPRLCNGHRELCGRKFSNVSMVVAHNSPFVVMHNAASNQQLPVLAQLNDGIRGLQFQTHLSNYNTSLHLCHTSCSLLDAGPLLTYLTTVTHWLSTHPNEVLAIMIGNGDRVSPSTYIRPFAASGMLPYIYTPPPHTNQSLSTWPTLNEMITRNKRVVVMLDYAANQTAVPWLLDEFAYQWQTPFSPTNSSFPCTQHRPPHQAEQVSKDRMYLLNHNLNIPLNLFNKHILMPALTLLDDINAANSSLNISLAANVERCTRGWGRPPNWLLVDFYNRGDFEGSVFEVAARANGVRYVRGRCCG
ncbi:PLC-like phosphodiesterase, partial [Periconia macrospinosa]